MRYFLTILPLFLLLLSSYSQNEPDHSLASLLGKHKPFITATYQHGGIIPTTDFVKGDNLSGAPINRYHAATIKVGLQNPGYAVWQRVYKGPTYGLGFFTGDFFNPREMGYPYAVFGFLGIPVARGRKLEVYTEFQYGLAWDWLHYDSLKNPRNLAIGSSITVYLDIAMKAVYPLTSNLDLGFGLSFTHFSNGGFERPNRGVNLYAPSVELKYFVNGRPDVRGIEPANRLARTNELVFMLGYGDHQIVEHELDTNYFAVGGLSLMYSMQHTNAFRSGPGIDLNYWWGMTAKPDGSPGPVGWDNLSVGLIYQPELIVDRFSLMGGIGIYARHLNYGNFTQTYQRLGVKCHIYRNYSFGVNVRAINFMLAEFMEFNLGYRLIWDK